MAWAVIYWLAAGSLWAVDNGRRAAVIEIGAVERPAPWTVTMDGADPMENHATPLNSPPAPDSFACSQTATANSILRKGSMPAEAEGTRTSDVAASFMLIGLGGGVLIGLRWRMGRQSVSDSFNLG